MRCDASKIAAAAAPVQRWLGHRRLGIRVGSANSGSVRSAILALLTIVKSFGIRLSFQRAAGIMRLNLADCDCDFSNDFWPLAIFRVSVGLDE